MSDLTAGQLACFVGLLYVGALYVFAYSLESLNRRKHKSGDRQDDLDVPDLPGAEKPASAKTMIQCLTSNTLIRAIQLHPEAVIECKDFFKAWLELGLILVWFYIADRSGYLPDGEKSYSRDFFLFFMFVLTLAFMWKSLPIEKKKGAPLNRDQTEEWKGWMQVMFLLYHYFEAREMYNAIRLFIACYVWMTGFGNFSYYYVRKDFTLGRFAQMMWRLNFFVFFCCLALNNNYMLYYICPMHTIFTLFIYGILGVMSEHNSSNVGVALKLGVCVLLVMFLWETPGVFKTVFRPLEFLVGYVDPRKPDVDPLHEWEFRSGLDRYVWIWGMICAYMHPRFERMLNWVDETNKTNAVIIRSALFAACVVAGTVYYNEIYCLPKLEYNQVHPYTSWIPITLFIVLRNLTPSLRSVHIAWYGWLGKITLETYIAQFHVWLSTGNVPNAQPAKLLVLIEGYPLMNFMLCSALYILASYRLFNITNDLKFLLLPLSDNKSLMQNFGIVAGAGLAFYLVGLGLKATTLEA
jgi:hypothetical protein